MNSFKSIERALEYEVSRQIEMAEKGTPIIQSTLRWDDVEGKTYLMRTKENAEDYRYFPESDLSVINVSEELINNIEKTLPELLSDKKTCPVKLSNLTVGQFNGNLWFSCNDVVPISK